MKNPSPQKKNRFTAVCIALTAACAALFFVISAVISENRPFAALFGRWSRFISAVLGQIFSVFPFPAAQAVVIMCVFALIFLAVRFVKTMISSGSKGILAVRAAAFVLACASSVFFLFNALWGFQYSADSQKVAQKLSLSPLQADADDLYSLTYLLLNRANESAQNVKRSSNGECDFGTFDDMAERAASACRALSNKYDGFSAPAYPRVKRVVAGEIMSAFGVAGIYFPFTGECNVNPDNVTTHLPMTMCHEMFHRLSAMSEDECNFMAILACVESEDADFLYSGWLCAYIYASNSLYTAAPDRAEELALLRSDEVSGDIARLNAHIKKYEGPVSDAGSAINDTYLKSMNQPEGMKTYGMVTDLLLSYFKDEY